MSLNSDSRTGMLLRIHRADGAVDEMYAVAGLTIGRSKANTVVLDGDTAVEAIHHARVDAIEDGRLCLRCPSAVSVLQVDGKWCREVRMEDGLRIRVGNTEIECVDSSARVAPSPVAAKSACPFCQNAETSLEGAEPRPCAGCGKELLPIPASDTRGTPVFVPTRFGNFRAQRFEARGGMGIVLRGHAVPAGSVTPSMDNLPAVAAFQKQTGNVAIKLLPASRRDVASQERFQREVALLSQIQHPNVVRFLATGVEADHQYLVMDWIEGGSLKEMIDRAASSGGLIPFESALEWFEQVLQGLDALHHSGVLHRDIKPSNILIDAAGVARIADLGIAKPITETELSLTTTGQTPGTSSYMAPEQRSCPDLVDQSTDLYSLGITFFEVLTGRLPVGLWRPISEINTTVPDDFNTVLMRMISQRKEDRFATAAEVIAAIQPALTKPAPAEPPVVQPKSRVWSFVESCGKTIGSIILVGIASLVGSCERGLKHGTSHLHAPSGSAKPITKGFDVGGSARSSPILPGTKYQFPQPGTVPNNKFGTQQPSLNKPVPNQNPSEWSQFNRGAAAHAYLHGRKEPKDTSNIKPSEQAAPSATSLVPNRNTGIAQNAEKSLQIEIPIGWHLSENSGIDDASSILLIKDNNAANIRLRRIRKAQNQILLDASRDAAAKFPEIRQGAVRHKTPFTVQGFSAIQERVNYFYGLAYFDGLAASVAVVTTVETRRPYVVVVVDSLAKEWWSVAPIYDQILREFREFQ